MTIYFFSTNHFETHAVCSIMNKVYSNKRMAPNKEWKFLTPLKFFYTSNYSLLIPLLPQQFQGDNPGTSYIAILHGVNSRWQFCCSVHTGRVLVCWASPWPVIENIYVVFQRCWYWNNITKKKNKKKEWTKFWFVRSKSCFATICKELAVKLYTKDIKNYIRMPE